MGFDTTNCISETAATDWGMASIYVLVDGQLRFEQKDIKKGQSHFIHVELHEDEQFLTLVTTQGSDRALPEGFNQEHGDWCLFGKPTLVLE